MHRPCRRSETWVGASGRMNGIVDAPHGPGDDPCTVTGIGAINEPGEGLAEGEITVSGSRASRWQDSTAEHPWYAQFHHRLRLRWGQGQRGWGPEGRIRIECPGPRWHGEP